MGPVFQAARCVRGLLEEVYIWKLTILCFTPRPSIVGTELVRDYRSYHSFRLSQDWVPRTDSYVFWRENIGRFPALSLLALKTLEFPPSSIAAERAFAMARKIAVSSRSSQTWQTFCREVYLRVNKEYVHNALEIALDRYRSS